MQNTPAGMSSLMTPKRLSVNAAIELDTRSFFENFMEQQRTFLGEDARSMR